MAEVQGRESEPAYCGWLSTELPFFSDTLSLKAALHTRPIGQRPFIELEPTDHPLAVEQHTGITMERARHLAELLEHQLYHCFARDCRRGVNFMALSSSERA